ncbi:hypothetical protein AAC387_Pa09g0656 [Persea americana]
MTRRSRLAVEIKQLTIFFETHLMASKWIIRVVRSKCHQAMLLFGTKPGKYRFGTLVHKYGAVASKDVGCTSETPNSLPQNCHFYNFPRCTVHLFCRYRIP